MTLRFLVLIISLLSSTLLSAQTDDEAILSFFEKNMDIADSDSICQVIKNEWDDRSDEVKAIYHWYRGQEAFDNYQLDSAGSHLSNCASLLRYSDNPEYAASVYLLLGEIQVERADINLAVESYLSAMQLARQYDDDETLLFTHLHFAEMYLYLGDTTSARASLNQAKAVQRGSPNDYHEAQLLVNMGEYAMDSDQEVGTILPVLHELRDLGDIDSYVFGHILMIEKYLANSQPDSVITTASTVGELAQLYDLSKYEVMAQQYLAIAYTNKGKVHMAKQLLDDLWQKYAHQPNDRATLAKIYADMYSQDGNMDSAYHYQSIHTGTMTSIERLTKMRSMADATLRYQNEEQEATIKAQKRKQRSLTVGALLALLILGLIGAITILAYRNKRIKIEQRAAINIAEQRAKAEKLEEISAFKNRFFTNVAHELKTPLSLIMDPLRRMNQDTDPNVTLAYRNSQKLQQLIDEIMELSKIESGQITIKNEEFGIVAFVKRVFHSFDSLAKGKELYLRLDNQLAEEHHILCDPKHLEKVLNNLISNAIKFSNKGTEVTCVISHSTSQLIISIRDQGEGLTPDEQRRVFNRYYQTQLGSESLGGTGIGLSLAQELTKALGGTIIVDSVVGDGSTFSISLPISDILIKTTPLSDESDASSADTAFNQPYTPLLIDGEKPKLLLIEDNEDMSTYLLSILAEHYHCDLATDGISGLQKLQTSSYHLVLSDVMMPHLNGFQLREKSKNLPGLADTSYAFLTAKSFSDDVLSGLRLGVDDYITKPFDSAELVARLNNLIKNRLARLDNGALSIIDNEDERLIKKVEETVLKHLSNPAFRVTDLAENLLLTKKQLNAQLKRIAGMTAVELILEMRLLKARTLIQKKKYNTIADIRSEVGITSASYFSTKFKQRFGKTPKELLES